jgi:hypothetical protein
MSIFTDPGEKSRTLDYEIVVQLHHKKALVDVIVGYVAILYTTPPSLVCRKVMKMFASTCILFSLM